MNSKDFKALEDFQGLVDLEDLEDKAGKMETKRLPSNFHDYFFTNIFSYIFYLA